MGKTAVLLSLAASCHREKLYVQGITRGREENKMGTLQVELVCVGGWIRNIYSLNS